MIIPCTEMPLELNIHALIAEFMTCSADVRKVNENAVILLVEERSGVPSEEVNDSKRRKVKEKPFLSPDARDVH